MTKKADLSTDINPLEIGCVDEGAADEPHKLLSYVFPSKIGGKPAWLALDSLPSNAQLHCNLCSKRLTFLMQVYCPVESPNSASISEESDTFHRCLYFFMCMNGDCYGNTEKAKMPNAPVKVFRSQLARSNAYYPFEPPNYEAKWSEVIKIIDANKLPHASSWQPLCALCGCPADGADAVQCPNCRYQPAGLYCCPEHRDADVDGHAERCKVFVDRKTNMQTGEFLLRFWTSSSNEKLPKTQLIGGVPLTQLGLVIGPDPGAQKADDNDEDDDDDESDVEENGKDQDMNGSVINKDGNKYLPDQKNRAGDDVEMDVGEIGEAADFIRNQTDDVNGHSKLADRQSSPTPLDNSAAGVVTDAAAAEANRSFEDFVAEIDKLAAKETPQLRKLAEFKKATRREPGQVFRYQRCGLPLLISSDALPTAPPCELCGSERQFECQITPQLLTWLPLNESPDTAGPDFGGVFVFTCSASCNPKQQAGSGSNYAEEFVAMQFI